MQIDQAAEPQSTDIQPGGSQPPFALGVTTYDQPLLDAPAMERDGQALEERLRTAVLAPGHHLEEAQRHAAAIGVISRSNSAAASSQARPR